MINCDLCPRKGSCCGVFPISKEIIEKHRDKFQVLPTKELDMGNEKMAILTEDILCVFLDRKTKLCSIYEDRPEICRMFGTTTEKDYMIACPYFKPNGHPWSEAKAKQILRITNHNIDNLMKK